jgi:hypothetical protein
MDVNGVWQSAYSTPNDIERGKGPTGTQLGNHTAVTCDLYGFASLGIGQNGRELRLCFGHLNGFHGVRALLI